VKDRSDDEIWVQLSEEPCLEMLTEWHQRLSWRLWQGVRDVWSSKQESPATDSREPDGRHHKAIGAGRMFQNDQNLECSSHLTLFGGNTGVWTNFSRRGWATFAHISTLTEKNCSS